MLTKTGLIGLENFSTNSADSFRRTKNCQKIAEVSQTIKGWHIFQWEVRGGGKYFCRPHWSQSHSEWMSHVVDCPAWQVQHIYVSLGILCFKTPVWESGNSQKTSIRNFVAKPVLWWFLRFLCMPFSAIDCVDLLSIIMNMKLSLPIGKSVGNTGQAVSTGFNMMLVW